MRISAYPPELAHSQSSDQTAWPSIRYLRNVATSLQLSYSYVQEYGLHIQATTILWNDIVDVIGHWSLRKPRERKMKQFLVFKWRHGGHVGVQNNNEKNILGIRFYYYAKLERHFAIVLYTNMAVLSHEWKPRISYIQSYFYNQKQLL